MSRAIALLCLTIGCFQSHSLSRSDLLGPEDAGSPLDPSCDDPSCESDIVIGFATTPSGENVKWDPTKGCIAVTYSPELAALQHDIQDALAVWSTACGELCLGELNESAEAPATEERRIHFRVGDPGSAAPELFGDATTFFASGTGEILSATIELFVTRLGSLPDGVPPTRAIAHDLGHALGFAHAIGDSIMSTDLARPASLSCTDRLAILRY